MQLASMRYQIVSESIFRMCDTFELEVDAKILFRIARITFADGAIRRHDAYLFVQIFSRRHATCEVRASGFSSDVEVADVERVLLDKNSARFYQVTHQFGENFFGGFQRSDLHPQE